MLPSFNIKLVGTKLEIICY